MKRIIFALFSGFGAASVAGAACKDDFSAQGFLLLSEIVYRAWDQIATNEAGALRRIAKSLHTDGYSNPLIKGRRVTAKQETSGSGHPQILRFTAKRAGNITRIGGRFTLQQGQIDGERVVRNELCRLIASAGP